MAQPINPYIAGAPLRGERGFFGRQDTLAWVQRELANPATNALVLFGQRRIGKTSLLLQLQRTLEGPSFLPVYFDLQDQATRPLNHVLYDLTDTIADKLGLDRHVSGSFDPRGVFFRKMVLPQVQQLLGANRRLVLLMDEFDVLDQAAQAELPEYAAAKGFFPFLRRIMTDDARPAFVFVVGRRAEDLALNFTATFKASLVREIWTLDPASAAALVRQAEDNGTLDFTDDAIARILSFTNHHPYLTQLICQRIWEHAYTTHPAAPPVIDTPQVESIVADALQAGNQALTWLWNGLSPAERIFAAALAENTGEGGVIKVDDIVQVLSANAERLITREVEAARGDLVKRHVLNEVSPGEYRFAVELFRRWVRQHRPLRDVKDELDRVNPEADQLFNFGHRYFRRREWQYAERYFRDALRENPKHFRARLFLGETLLEINQKEAAVGELQQAYDLDRDEARLPLARGLRELALVREQAGDDDGALLAIDRALQILPAEQAAKDVRARLWVKRGDAALAQDDLDKALAAYHEAGLAERVAHVEALQKRKALNVIETRATTHALNKNWREAANIYGQLIAQAPDEKSRNQWDAARALAAEEQELHDLFEDGLEAYHAKQWPAAQKALAEVVKRRPGYARDDQTAARLLRRVEDELDRPRRRRELYLTARKWVSVALVGIFTVSLLAIGSVALTALFATPTETPTDETAIAALTLTAELLPSDVPTVETLVTTDALTPSDTHTPEPTLGDTDTPEPTPTPELVLEGTPLPTPAELISLDTASRLGQLARWGRGALINVAYASNGTLAVASAIGVYLYDDTLTELAFLDTGMTANHLAFSPDGGELAVGSFNSDAVQIWRVSDGALLAFLPGHEGGVLAVAFSPDNITLAVSAGNGQILFWDVDRAEQNREPLNAGVMTSLAFSPVQDNPLLASGSAEGEVFIWGSEGDEPLQTFADHAADTADPAVLSLAFSPDGAQLASGGASSRVFLWEVATGITLWNIHSAVEREIWSLAFSPDGAFLAVGSVGEVNLLQVSDSQAVWPESFQDQNGNVYLAFSPDTKNPTLVSAANDGSIHVRAVETGETLAEFDKFPTAVWSLAVSPTGRFVAAGYEKGSIGIWQVRRSVSRSDIELVTDPILSLAFAPDENNLAVGLYQWVKVLSLDGAVLNEHQEHNAEVWGVAFSADSLLVASASEDSTVRIWDWTNPEGPPLVVLPGPDAATSLAFSVDASLVLVGYRDGAADVWQLTAPASAPAARLLAPRLGPVSLCTLGESGSPIVAVAFTADDTLALALNESGVLYQCDLTNFTVSSIQLGEGGFTLRTAAFSPDRQLVAGGFGDSSIAIWSLADGALQTQLFGHTAAVNALAFWPDSSRLISASEDGTVRAWQVR